jgi:glutamine amidotransferase
VNADVVLLDSGGSNYASLQAAFERLGARCQQSEDPARIRAATHVVLPGVGSAGAAMAAITERDMAPVIRSLTQPVLGICLGMQILFSHSEESDVAMLDLIPGRVRRLPASLGIRIPHMGWNDVVPRDGAPLIERGEAYFLHGYQFDAANAADVLARTDHGGPLVAAVGRDNIMGVQFHPEKSQAYGINFLKRFLEWMP